jgi:hypothetical protein
LLATDLDYEIVVLENTTRKGLIDAERWWIAFGRACAWPLTNHTDGGDGLLNPSRRTRAKISAAMKTRMSTPEAREHSRALARAHLHTAAAISAATEAKRSPEARAASSRAQKDRWTPEQRAQAGAISRERNRTPEMRARIGALSSKHMSTPEAKTRQSAISRARFATAEARAAHAAAIKIRTRLFGDENPARREDVRAKMRASSRLRHEREMRERAEARLTELVEVKDA